MEFSLDAQISRSNRNQRIGFKLNPSATLDIGYRYLNTGTVNTLLNPQTGLTIHQNNASQQFLVGVRYYLQ
jgi:opacity protein-like surface antigen